MRNQGDLHEPADLESLSHCKVLRLPILVSSQSCYILHISMPCVTLPIFVCHGREGEEYRIKA